MNMFMSCGLTPFAILVKQNLAFPDALGIGPGDLEPAP